MTDPWTPDPRTLEWAAKQLLDVRVIGENRISGPASAADMLRRLAWFHGGGSR